MSRFTDRRPASGVLATLVALVATAGCGGSGATGPSSGGPTSPGNGFPQGSLVLTASPIDIGAIRWITPLGNLNPPDHTLPTDHIYFYVANPDIGESPGARRTTFYAPGSGTVTFVIGGGVGQESKIMVRQTSTFSYYVDHVIVTSPVTTGTVIAAGQVLGTSGSVYAVDLGVINDSLTVGFLNPSRYSNSDSLHADAPLKYYTEPLRSQLYGMVQRLGADRDGTINYDKAGSLSGNWFSTFGNVPLSFAADTYDPARVRISVGVGNLPGVYGIASASPSVAPGDVSAATGRVLFGLYRTQSGPGGAVGPATVWMLVEMTDSTHIREQMFSAIPADFTASALTFAR